MVNRRHCLYRLTAAAHIGARLPELGQVDAGPLVVASDQANSTALLDGLMRGGRWTPWRRSREVRQFTRALVQRGLALSLVMRADRVGAAYVTERWVGAVRRCSLTDGEDVRRALAEPDLDLAAASAGLG